MPRPCYVYILANRSRTLYVGVTSNLARRLVQHRTGPATSFTRRYALFRLVHVELAPSPRDAITREKQIKQWTRRKKLALIEASNPNWKDLSDGMIP